MTVLFLTRMFIFMENAGIAKLWIFYLTLYTQKSNEAWLNRICSFLGVCYIKVDRS
jgi:hypothetical protein